MTRPRPRGILLDVNIPGTRFVSIISFLVMWFVPAGAATLQSAPGHLSGPAVLAAVGACFFVLGFMRRRYSGD
jgi:hypothetical protein